MASCRSRVYYCKFIQNNDALQRLSLRRNEVEEREREGQRHTYDEALPCIICGHCFQWKKEIIDHEDKNHKITNTDIVRLKARISSDNNNNWLLVVLSTTLYWRLYLIDSTTGLTGLKTWVLYNSGKANQKRLVGYCRILSEILSVYPRLLLLWRLFFPYHVAYLNVDLKKP